MKIVLVLILAILLSGCGKGGSPATGMSKSIPPTSVQQADDEVTYTIRLTGDNIQFTLSMFADLNTPDEEQVVIGPTTVLPGQTLEYSITAKKALNSAGVSRMTTSSDLLHAVMYRNGILVEDYIMYTGGTYHNFPSETL